MRHCPIVEALEIVEPFLTNLDTSRPIMRIILVCGGSGTLLHALPYSIQWVVSQAMRTGRHISSTTFLALSACTTL